MSPIIELQRRLVEKGRIRAGDKGPKGEPRKIVNWRLTSKDRTCLEAAAERWGGEVREWEGREGEFELYTNTSQLPIALIPETAPTQWYELWTGGGCKRRCDGVHELLSDGPCLCGEKRECEMHTRLTVLLPDLPGLGSWRVESKGYNAAVELPGVVQLLQSLSHRGEIVPARLRLEPRHEIKNGKTRRFAVPVIDIDVSFRELLGGQGSSHQPAADSLPSGYIPIAPAPDNGTSLEAGLHAAETQTLSRPPRVELPDLDPDEDDETPAVVPLESPPPPPETISQAQRRRLFKIASENEVSKDHLRGLILDLTGTESTAAMSLEHYDSIVALIESRGRM